MVGRVMAVEHLTSDGAFEDPGRSHTSTLSRVTYQGMSLAWPAIGNDAKTGGAIIDLTAA